MRPNRSIVVRDRVIASLLKCYRSDPPTTEKFWSEKLTSDGYAMIGRCNAREKTVAGIGCTHETWLFATVQCKGIHADFVGPKAFFESSLQSSGLLLELSSLF